MWVFVDVAWDVLVVVVGTGSQAFLCCLPVGGGTGEASR